MRHSTTLAVIAAVLTSSVLWNVAQAGDVYKYVDERGNTLYTDRPMPGAVRVSSGVVRPPEVNQRSYAAQQAAANQGMAANDQRIAQSKDDQRVAATVQKDVEASHAESCKKAREQYNNSINARRLYHLDKDGNRVYLSDAELSQSRLDSAKAVEAFCGPKG
jgi:hypothetical protein